jgi:hypothetical protein
MLFDNHKSKEEPTMLNLRSRFPQRVWQALACATLAIGLAGHCLGAPPIKKPSDQLYIEVAALGSLDYFYDHKLGLQKAGEALGVKTQYVALRARSAFFHATKTSPQKAPTGRRTCWF